MTYGFSLELAESFAEAENRVVAALKEEGFGILADIDVQATLKNKAAVDIRPYKILGACNPALASKAVIAEPDIGLLLPCNVVLRETEQGGVHVAFMDPEAVLNLVGRDEIKKLAGEVRSRLERVVQALKA